MAEALLSGSSRARILELEAEVERLRKTHAQEQNERVAAGAELGRLRGALNAADNEKARLREEVERLRAVERAAKALCNRRDHGMMLADLRQVLEGKENYCAGCETSYCGVHGTA